MSLNIDYLAEFIKLRFIHLILKQIFTLIITIVNDHHLKYL